MNAGERHNIHIAIEGIQYSGWFEVRSGLVRVSCSYGTKSTKTSGASPEILARMLLRDLIEAKKPRPC